MILLLLNRLCLLVLSVVWILLWVGLICFSCWWNVVVWCWCVRCRFVCGYCSLGKFVLLWFCCRLLYLWCGVLSCWFVLLVYCFVEVVELKVVGILF